MSGHIYVFRSIHVVSVSTIIFWNCSYIVVYFVFDLKLSYMCVRIAVFYQARRVSGHICVLGLRCFTRPGE